MKKAKRQSWDTNRWRSSLPKGWGMWCDCCDAYIVFPGQRCPHCKYHNNEKRKQRLSANLLRNIY